MKKGQFLLTGCVCLLLLTGSLLSSAQPTQVELPADAGKPTKVLIAKDKTAIIEIFRTLAPANYRLWIGSESKGTLAVPSVVWVLVKPGEYSASARTMFGGYYSNIGLLYAVSGSPDKGFEGIFGKTNAAKLQAIINKYTAGQ